MAAGPVIDPVFYYYHTDHLGSATIMTNRYTGQQIDEDTGLYFYQSRYYDPELARFIQADTIVPSSNTSQALNRYAYVDNNPLKFTDPSGHGKWYQPKSWWKGAKNAVSSAWRGFSRAVSSAWKAVKPYVGTIATVALTPVIGPFAAAAVGSAIGAAVNGGTWKSFAIGVGIGIAAGGIVDGLGINFGGGIPGKLAAGALTGAVSGAISSAVYGGKTLSNMLAGAAGGAIGASIAMATRAISTSVRGMSVTKRVVALAIADPKDITIDPISIQGPMTDLEIFAYVGELRAMVRLGDIDAVEGLARVAEVLADRYGGFWSDDETGFVKHFQRLLTEYDGLFPTNEGFIDSFGVTGFGSWYNDGSAVQSRHFVGFLGAGYHTRNIGKFLGIGPLASGLGGGSAALWLNGDSTWRLNQPDTALGYKAAWLGARLKGGLFFNLSLKDVPDYIRKEFRD